MGQLDFTTITSVLAACTMLTLVVGYIRALTTEHGTVFHLAMSICLVLVSYVGRTVYWDIFAIHGLHLFNQFEVNPVFDLVAIWGGIHGHAAIYRMIPSDERHKWSILTAWAYPPFVLSKPLRRFLRWLFWRRS